MADIFSTLTLPRAQQFEAWHAWLADVFDAEEPDRDGFAAENSFWQLGDLGIAIARVPSLRVSRTPQLISRQPVDHWVLSVADRAMRVSTDKAEHTVPGRIPFLFSLGHPFQALRPADERIHVYLPRDLAPRLAGFDAARGFVLDAPFGRLLASFLQGLAASLPQMSGSELTQAGSALRAMLGGCLRPDADAVAEAGPYLHSVRLARVQAAIRRHVALPELGVEMLCGMAGVSRSQLYRLLEGEGGVMHAIRRERLHACRRQLEDPHETRPIREIAATYGFEDPSLFSRAFRREFGMSPGGARVRAPASVAVGHPAPGRARGGFVEHLLQL
ncbi:helix-turn-helix domain-containing protein [Roseococcus sp. YIM B11640]|uniref:helix-turn-helix domain-containing protein n=1 Tax=Roseococcus sp. YIM B11640 TaxID=3133973 RepID=UPI003C7B71E9